MAKYWEYVPYARLRNYTATLKKAEFDVIRDNVMAERVKSKFGNWSLWDFVCDAMMQPCTCSKIKAKDNDAVHVCPEVENDQSAAGHNPDKWSDESKKATPANIAKWVSESYKYNNWKRVWKHKQV